MNIGVLYYEGGKGETVARKIEKVLAEYRAKYGELESVYVHPTMLDGTESECGVLVKTGNTVMFNNIWIERVSLK